MSNHNLDFDGLLPVDAFKKVGGRMSLHGGGSPAPPPAPTSTQQSTVSYPPEVKPLVMETLNRAQALSSMPYQQYGKNQVAGFDPLQLQAQQGAANLQTSPTLDTATQMAGLAGLRGMSTSYDPMAYQAQQVYNPQLQNYQMQGPGSIYTGSFTQPGVASQYMSPYQQNVTDISKREALRQYGIQQSQLKGQATQSGAFGGGRQAILQNEANRSMNQNLADIQARGGQAAYEQAQGLYGNEAQRALAAAQANQNVGLQVGQQNLQAMLGVQQLGANQSLAAQQANQQAAQAAQQANEQSRQYGAGLGLQGNQQALTAAQQLAGLGATQFGQQQAVITGENAAGAQRQALEQQRISTDYQNFLQQQQYPYQQTAWMTELLKSAPQQTTQSIYQAPPSTGAQLSGLASMYLGGAKSGYWANGGLTGLGLYNMSKGE